MVPMMSVRQICRDPPECSGLPGKWQGNAQESMEHHHHFSVNGKPQNIVIGEQHPARALGNQLIVVYGIESCLHMRKS